MVNAKRTRGIKITRSMVLINGRYRDRRTGRFISKKEANRRRKLSKASKKQLYRYVTGYNGIPVAKRYYSITFTAFARKKEDLPTLGEALHMIEKEMELNFGKYWRDWIPQYWERTGISIERRKFENRHDGEQEVRVRQID